MSHNVDTVREIERAIREHLVIEAAYREEDKGAEPEPTTPGMRLVEPHHLHIDHRGHLQLLVWQVDGFSRKGNLPDWRTLHVAGLSHITVLHTIFTLRPDFQVMLQGLDFATTVANIEP